MDRLTDKNPCNSCNVDRQIGNPYRWQCECDRCKKPTNWREECVNKLKYYEDLEEQGLLLKLPCKVGDTVYAIEANEEEFEHFHCGLKISKCDFDFWMIPLWGKCIFLTQAEAEEALRKMNDMEQ